MILSASRRTDIPAFHAEWFFRRLREGFAMMKNSTRDGRYYRVPLTPEGIDCIVFRTKNPAPMLARLDELRDYRYLFNITMNPYGREMEAHLPRLVERVETYKRLAKQIGPERMIWRYDPVMLSPKYDLDFHRRAFDYLCRELAPYSYKCMIGFIINHPFIASRMAPMTIEQRSEADMLAIGQLFGRIAAQHDHPIETCATEVDLEEFGITHGACVERRQIERIVGYRFEGVNERYRLRPHCNCMESVDIGHYSTCGNGCRYCYATTSKVRLGGNPLSPSLDPWFDEHLAAGKIPPEWIIDVACRSFKPRQASLW